MLSSASASPVWGIERLVRPGNHFLSPSSVLGRLQRRLVLTRSWVDPHTTSLRSASSVLKPLRLQLGARARVDCVDKQKLQERCLPSFGVQTVTEFGEFEVMSHCSTFSSIFIRWGNVVACIFRIAFARCTFTVTSLNPSSAAICLFSFPAATLAITSRSRRLKDR